MNKPKCPLTTREKLVILFFIVILRMVNPSEYPHEFEKFFTEIKELLKLEA